MARKYQSKTKQVDLFFSSVSAAKLDAEGTYSLSYNKSLSHSFLNKPDNLAWFGVGGGSAGVLDSFVTGNATAEAKVRGFHESILADLPRAEGINRAIVRGAMGDELDIHTVNRGATDKAWTSRQRRVRRGSSILRLCVDICGNSSMNASTLQWRGIAALALSEVMTKAGYSVEIVAALAVTNAVSAHNITACTVIKPRNTPADIGLLAATIGTAGFFRVIGFCQIARAADSIGKEVDSSLGHYLDVSGVLPVPDKVAQIFVDNSVINEASARKWVRDTVKLLQG
jgi:hypothetical protein